MSIAPILTRAERYLEWIEQALADLSQISVVYSSPDGLVIAEADGTGSLVGLWIDETSDPSMAGDLARTIVDAAQRASVLSGAQRDHVLAGLTSRMAPAHDGS